LLGANIGAVHVGNRIWVPQTMPMTNNADDVVAARAGRNSPPTHGGDPCTSGSDTTLIR
jgi:hypothetical protein